MGYIRPEQKQFIQDKQVQLANLLKQSFYFAKQDRVRQVKFLRTAMPDLNIFEFHTEEILNNEHIFSELSSALEAKHPGRVQPKNVYEKFRQEIDALIRLNNDI